MVRNGIYGLCCGDALGVPAEFRTRESLKENPFCDMVSGGIHDQPAGYWSDDSSMTLCTMDSFAEAGYFNTHDIMTCFNMWWKDGKYSPGGKCFDIGNTVVRALRQSEEGITPEFCGGCELYDNGNGSLMRILPAAYILHKKYGKDITMYDLAMEEVHTLSALTHRHPLAQSACGIYITIAVRLIDGQKLEDAISDGIQTSLKWYKRHEKFKCILPYWDRIAEADTLKSIPESEIRSGGFVVETLEAALWCLLNTNNYKDCVLKAVNLGYDTDTTAAVAGGLAGIYYGIESIPKQWLDQLAAKEIIETCCSKMENRYGLYL